MKNIFFFIIQHCLYWLPILVFRVQLGYNSKRILLNKYRPCQTNKYLKYFDFDIGEDFSSVDGNNRSDHFWSNNTISQMGFNWVWFGSWFSAFFFGLSNFNPKSVIFMFILSSKSSSLSSWEQLNEFFWFHFQ